MKDLRGPCVFGKWLRSNVCSAVGKRGQDSYLWKSLGGLSPSKLGVMLGAGWVLPPCCKDGITFSSRTALAAELILVLRVRGVRNFSNIDQCRRAMKFLALSILRVFVKGMVASRCATQ